MWQVEGNGHQRLYRGEWVAEVRPLPCRRCYAMVLMRRLVGTMEVYHFKCYNDLDTAKSAMEAEIEKRVNGASLEAK